MRDDLFARSLAVDRERSRRDVIADALDELLIGQADHLVRRDLVFYSVRHREHKRGEFGIGRAR
jgi:hypothetical protein